MPHCCKRSSSTRPGGRSGNGNGNGNGSDGDDVTGRDVDARRDFVAEDDENREAGS